MKTICFFLLLTALMLEAAPPNKGPKFDHQKGEYVRNKPQFVRCGDVHPTDNCLAVPSCSDGDAIGYCEGWTQCCRHPDRAPTRPPRPLFG
ncbi:hypothetical protein ACROYT_G003343 [Oculina patagonica]